MTPEQGVESQMDAMSKISQEVQDKKLKVDFVDIFCEKGG